MELENLGRAAALARDLVQAKAMLRETAHNDFGDAWAFALVRVSQAEVDAQIVGERGEGDRVTYVGPLAAIAFLGQHVAHIEGLLRGLGVTIAAEVSRAMAADPEEALLDAVRGAFTPPARPEPIKTHEEPQMPAPPAPPAAATPPACPPMQSLFRHPMSDWPAMLKWATSYRDGSGTLLVKSADLNEGPLYSQDELVAMFDVAMPRLRRIAALWDRLAADERERLLLAGRPEVAAVDTRSESERLADERWGQEEAGHPGAPVRS